MSRSKNSPKTPTTAPNGFKLCHILKRSDFDGYGFNLHSEKVKPGQFIGKVDANSPASEAGLKEGDRIIEVNDVPVGNETHKQVVQRIKTIANEVRLLLIDVDEANSSQPGKDAGNGSTTVKSDTDNTNESQGRAREIQNATTNTSQKRISNDSSNGSKASTATGVPVDPPTLSASADVTDRGYMKNGGNLSPTDLQANQEKQQHLFLSSTTKSAATISSSGTDVPSSNGSLQLPMTAAEMRAKLMSKKKYDPKNESVDLKKKFEIIQKL